MAPSMSYGAKTTTKPSFLTMVDPQNLEPRMDQVADGTPGTFDCNNPLGDTPEVRSVPVPRFTDNTPSSTNITITFENLKTLINEAISKKLPQAGV